MAETKLSDRALAVFAFAIYHQLGSGERVSQVVRRDGAGHEADPDAVDELRRSGLVTVEDDRLQFTADAERLVKDLIEAMRRTLARPEPA